MMSKKFVLFTILLIASIFFLNNVSAVSAECTDSDGQEYFTKGTTNYNSMSYTDRCYENDARYLLEYYCDSVEFLKTEWKLCVNGCVDGACQKSQNDCTPNWQPTVLSACINGKQTRSYTDTNNCGVAANKPADEILNCYFYVDILGNQSPSPLNVRYGDRTANISWTSLGTDYCIASDSYGSYFSGTKNRSGSEIVSVPLTSGSYIYSIECYGSGGNVKASLQINVPNGPSDCTPNWQAGAWSACINGTQTKTFFDSNNCGVTTNKPTDQIQNCQANCTPNWQAGTWSACTLGVQKRSYIDTNNCGVTSGKPNDETQSCNSATCTDSDGGRDYFIKGRLDYRNLIYVDFCYDKDPRYLAEYYCTINGLGKSEWKLCENGCIDGACKKSTCTPNWQAGAWSACINGRQSRSYVDSNNCGTTTGKPVDETQNCQANCTPNWQAGAWSTCTSGKQTRTYTDSNICGTTTGKPVDETQNCGNNNNLNPTVDLKVSADGAFYDTVTLRYSQKVTLSWTSKNASWCTDNAEGWYNFSNMPLSGTIQSNTITKTTTYTIICYGNNGNVSATDSAIVEFTGLPPTTALPVNLKVTDPSATVAGVMVEGPVTSTKGGSLWLSWTTSNSNIASCTASGDWQGVKTNYCSTPSLISAYKCSEQIFPNTSPSSVYTITCRDYSTGNTVSDTVTVNLAPDPVTKVDLKVTGIGPTPLDGPVTVGSGNLFNLSWEQIGTGWYYPCTASGNWSGIKGSSGSMSITITTSGIYNISCGSQGNVISDSVTVNVSVPTLDLKVNGSSGTVNAFIGDSATLSWTSSDPTTSPTISTKCTATGDWQGARSISGTESTGYFRSIKDYVYYLSCYGAGGLAESSVTVKVSCNPNSQSCNPSTCTPNWQPGTWERCVVPYGQYVGRQTRAYVDYNNCRITTGKPANDSQECTATCTPNWVCGEWMGDCNAFSNPGKIQKKHCEAQGCNVSGSSGRDEYRICGTINSNCVDSDDDKDAYGGKDYYQKGQVRVADPSVGYNGGTNGMDMCVGNRLIEYFCEQKYSNKPETIANEYKECENGCELGRCIIPKACTSSWQAGAWSTCTNGKQTRTYTDSNKCGVTTGKPADETQNCGTSCTPNWQAGAWSACINGKQTRSYADSNNCSIPITPKPADETQSCSVCSGITAECLYIRANSSDGPVKIKSGESISLSWESQEVASCIASGNWPSWYKYLNSQSAGEQRIYLDNYTGAEKTYSYTITCNKSSGQISDTVDVIVLPYANCTPNWQAGAWSACINGRQSRSYVDSNNCGTTTGKPVDETQNCSTSAACTDSDNGKSYFTSGTVKYGNLVYSDSCKGNYLYEYFCTTTGYANVLTELCSNGCLNGACKTTTSCTPNWQAGAWSTCTNGKQTRSYTDYNNCGVIINKPASETLTCTAPTVKCTDSDGGKNYSTIGILKFANKIYVDYCYASNPMYLSEYFCDTGNLGKSEWKLCANGCLEGVCK